MKRTLLALVLIVSILIGLYQFGTKALLNTAVGRCIDGTFSCISETGGWPKDSSGHAKCWSPEGSLYNASPVEKWRKGCGANP